MSRLPTISTPGRFTTPPPPSTGIPTPTHRRPRSSLGPSHNPLPHSTPDEAMDQLQEALRNRPAPGSIKSRDLSNGSKGSDDPDTPTQVPINNNIDRLAAPRTPALRSRTPSSLGIGQPTTPASRPASRPSLSGRPSLGASGTGVFTPRRPSMASSTSTTPYAKRPESRASNVHEMTRFDPKIGDRVRIQSLGQEGALRFMGSTEFKAGVWAGVELSGGFAGMGKNDGSVDGVSYFTCPPNCGIFVLFSKLSPPTSGPSRSASVASHRSLASSHASFSISGRATPSISGRATPSQDRVRPATTTPGRAGHRAVSQSVRGIQRLHEADESSPSDIHNRPMRTTLGTSTSSNALPEVRVTAGSRASKYVGMTAKQLDTARGVNGPPLNKSLLAASTTTPKASRISMGGATPARSRQSLGGSMVTPKPRGRISTVSEMMPPPPSPSNVTRALAQNHSSNLEAEIQELKLRNQQLEDQLRSSHTTSDEESTIRLEELKSEVEKIKEESDSLRYQLTASQADANDSTQLATELSEAMSKLTDEIEEKEREFKNVEKELVLEKERLRGEMEAGMEARRVEVRKLELRAEGAEVECADMRGLVEELTQAGQATISLYERKLNDSQNKQYDLDSQLRLLEATIQTLKDEANLQATPSSPGTTTRKAITAAEIDNENLTAQLKHLQTKIQNLEDELEETRHQADVDLENWKARVNKVKEGESKGRDEVKRLKVEIEGFRSEIGLGRGRIGELESALKENQIALESTRAEVESLRAEAAEATSMRAALQTANANEKALTASREEITELNNKLAKAEKAESKVFELENKISSLQTEVDSLKRTDLPQDPNRLSISIPLSPSRTQSPSPFSHRDINPTSPSSSPFLPGTPRTKLRLSTGSNGSSHSNGPGVDKTLRGFQHIIQDLTGENAELKGRIGELEDEMKLLKEEIKLLEETSGLGGDDGVKDLLEAKATIDSHIQTIKELNQEVSELESLIESKIYLEDELETRAQKYQKEMEQWKSKAVLLGHSPTLPSTASTASTFTHSRTVSNASGATGTTDGEERCELCEGPHGLDVCPVFNGEGLGDGLSPSAGRTGVGGGKGKWCADCESAAHDTVDCPMAEEVF